MNIHDPKAHTAALGGLAAVVVCLLVILFGSGTAEAACTKSALTTSINNAFPTNGIGAISGSSTRTNLVADFNCTATLDDPNAFSQPQSIIGSNASPLGSSFQELAVQNSVTTALSIYQQVFPGVSDYSAISGTAVIPTGSTVNLANGVSGYISNQSTGTNGVALFGVAIAGVDGSAAWGNNKLVTDANTRAVGTGVGRIIIADEGDVNVMNPGTEAIGYSAGGNWLAQSSNSLAFIVNNVGAGFHWNYGFSSQPGAATVGLALGQLAPSGTNISSQPINFSWFDGSGVAHTDILQSASGYSVLSSSFGGWNGFNVQGGNLTLSQSFSIVSNGFSLLSSDGSSDTLLGNSSNETILRGSSILAQSPVTITPVATFPAPAAGTQLQLASAGSSFVELDSTAASANTIYQRTNGSFTSPAALANNDVIGGFQWRGHNGSAYSSAQALIRTLAVGAWTGSNEATVIQFGTTPAASTVEATAMSVYAGIVIGTGTTDPGAGNLTASGALTGNTLVSAVATGTAPLTVASTTNVANLNASSLSGATFAAPGAIGGTTPNSGAFTAVTAKGTVPTGTTGSCVASSFSGGATAGKFAAAVCAGGTIILSAMPAQPAGYSCAAEDQTTPTDTVVQTASSTTSVTFKATNAAADSIAYQCTGW